MPLIKGAKISQTQQSQQSVNPTLQGLSQLVQGAAESGAGLLGLPGTLTKFSTGKEILPTSERLIGGVRNIAEKYLPEQYQQPKDTEEKFIRNLGSGIPGAVLALATGGAAAPIALSAFGGAAGETAAEKAGLGTLGQIAGGFIGSAGFTKGFHTLQRRYDIKPQDLVGTATKAQEALYDAEKKLGEHITYPAKSYEKKLLKLEDKINRSSALKSTQKTELVDKVQQAIKDIEKRVVGNPVVSEGVITPPVVMEEFINASTLVDRKKQNNAFYKHLDGYKNKEAREYLDQLQKIIFDEGENIGKNHPEWLSSWKDADDITKVIKYGENLSEILEETPIITKILKSKIAQTALGAAGIGSGYYVGGGPLALGAAGLGAAGYYGFTKSKELSRYLEKPITQRLLGDAFKYTINRQIPQLVKTLSKLNKNSEKFEKQHPEVLEQLSEKPKVGLIKGKKITQK